MHRRSGRSLPEVSSSHANHSVQNTLSNILKRCPSSIETQGPPRVPVTLPAFPKDLALGAWALATWGYEGPAQKHWILVTVMGPHVGYDFKIMCSRSRRPYVMAPSTVRHGSQPGRLFQFENRDLRKSPPKGFRAVIRCSGIGSGS